MLKPIFKSGYLQVNRQWYYFHRLECLVEFLARGIDNALPLNHCRGQTLGALRGNVPANIKHNGHRYVLTHDVPTAHFLFVIDTDSDFHLALTELIAAFFSSTLDCA